MKTHIRVRAEGTGVMLKTLVTFLVLFYDSKADMDGALALIAFAMGQLSYSLCLLGVYLSHYGFSALFPISPSTRSVGSFHLLPSLIPCEVRRTVPSTMG
jgi:oligosaccharide translocation protein RFT1